MDELSRPEAAGRPWSKITKPIWIGIVVSLAIIVTIIVSRDPTMYDDFNNPLYNGKFNTALWNAEINAGKIVQGNGLLTFELNTAESRNGLWTQTLYKPTYPIFIESKMMLETTSTIDAHIQVSFISETGRDNTCGIYQHASGADTPVVSCTSELELPEIPQENYSTPMTPGEWHLIRIELYPDYMTFVFFVDGDRIGSYVPQNPDALKDLGYTPAVFMYSGSDSAPKAIGYVDYVKIGKIEKHLYLADLEPTSVAVGAEELVVGKYPFSEEPILEGTTILQAKNGEKFPYGLFAHAPSEVKYSLPENAVTFSSSIFLGGNDRCGGSAMFIVLLDDQEIYRSSPVSYNDTFDPIDISVSVKGGQILTLITDPIDDNDCDWTVWGDPYLILR